MTVSFAHFVASPFRIGTLSCGTVATAALKRKKLAEQELDRLAGTRLQIEMQVSTLESANLNAETMAAMKKGADALKVIHSKVYVLHIGILINK